MLKFPVFVVGSPRSGTSILVQGLHGAGYAGCDEGNLLSILRPVSQTIDQHYGDFGSTNPLVLTAHINAEQLKAAWFGALRDLVDRHHAGKPWLDKTGNPEMMEIIPILRALWPQSRFIFAKRRGIENIVSRMKKFPQFTFEYHCRDWARNMETWRRMIEADPTIPGLEVDQRDIAMAPEATAARIGAFLDMQAASLAEMTRIFVVERPQETEAGSAMRELSLENSGWTQAEKAVFKEICGGAMGQLGYF
jgi:hypothetical protein